MKQIIRFLLTVVLCGIITVGIRRVGRRHPFSIPIGQARVRITRHDPRTLTNQTSAFSNNNTTLSDTDPGQDKSWKKHSYYSSRKQKVASLDLDDMLQDQPNQQSNYDTVAEYEKELRRRQDLRKRHEEERQRRLEERRRLENERRRLEDIRRQQDEDRRRQLNEQAREQEQQPQVTDGYQDTRRYVTPNQHSDSRRQQQQVNSTTNNQNREASQDYASQDALLRRGNNQYDQQYVPNRQQSGGRSNPPDSSQTYQYPYQQPSINQQGVYGRTHGYQVGSNNNPNLYQGFTYQPGTHIIANQRPASTQQPIYNRGQTDQRLPLQPHRDVYPGFRTHYEYGGQGQNQWNSYQDLGGNVGSYYPYDEQNAYSNCPDTGIELRINGMSCQQAIQQFGNSLCYTHEYTSKQCCEMCRPMKQPSRIGCEYGDHASQCSSINPADCYDLRNRQICCEACQKLRRNDTPLGCEYGDMSIRCDTVRQNPGLCYRPDNQRICCDTCSKTRNVSNPGCPWGDFDHGLCQMFDDNTNNVRINCYSHQRRRLCCQSCERLREWIPDNLPDDCQYGDRHVTFSTSHFGRLNCSNILNHFSTDECRTNPAVYMNCCYTCHRYRNNQG